MTSTLDVKQNCGSHDMVVNVGLPCHKGGMLPITQGLEIAWSTLPAVPSTQWLVGVEENANLPPIKCSKYQKVCIPACGCNADIDRNQNVVIRYVNNFL